jgi:hypothetical protein
MKIIIVMKQLSTMHSKKPRLCSICHCTLRNNAPCHNKIKCMTLSMIKHQIINFNRNITLVSLEDTLAWAKNQEAQPWKSKKHFHTVLTLPTDPPPLSNYKNQFIGYTWPPTKHPKAPTPLHGPNIYPPTTNSQPFKSLYAHATNLARLLTRLLANALDMPEMASVADETQTEDGGETLSLMRIFKYYAYDAADPGSGSGGRYRNHVDRIG